MSKVITLRIPQPIIDQVETIEHQQDLPKSQILIQLLNEALAARGLKTTQNSHTLNGKLQNLQSTSTTQKLLEMHAAIAEIVRFTYDPNKSKFKGQCTSASEVMFAISTQVDQNRAALPGN